MTTDNPADDDNSSAANVIEFTKEFRKMIRPESTTDQARQDEGALLKAALKREKVTQYELADHLQLTQAQVSQWLRKTDPRQCPDWAFVSAAALLDFDPSVHRPHLVAMQKNLNKCLGDESLADARADIIRRFLELDRDSRNRIAGQIEAHLGD